MHTHIHTYKQDLATSGIFFNVFLLTLSQYTFNVKKKIYIHTYIHTCIHTYILHTSKGKTNITDETLEHIKRRKNTHTHTHTHTHTQI